MESASKLNKDLFISFWKNFGIFDEFSKNVTLKNSIEIGLSKIWQKMKKNHSTSKNQKPYPDPFTKSVLSSSMQLPFEIAHLQRFWNSVMLPPQSRNNHVFRHFKPLDRCAPAPNHLHIKTPWLFLPAKLQGYLKRLCTISYNGCYILVQTLCSSLLDVLLLG